jgi:hypothetical protein
MGRMILPVGEEIVEWALRKRPLKCIAEQFNLPLRAVEIFVREQFKKQQEQADEEIILARNSIPNHHVRVGPRYGKRRWIV